ncbi:MAG: AI-2E family transporter [bacterium]
MDIIKSWFTRHFSNPQVVILAILLIAGTMIIIGLGKILAPAFAALIIAYLLEALVHKISSAKSKRPLAVGIVFSLFILIMGLAILGILPLLIKQVSQFVQQIPSIASKAQAALLQLPERYPDLLSEAQINDLIATFTNELAGFGQAMLATSISSVASLMTLAVYLVLVPILVFFFLKDKTLLIKWFTRFLPQDSQLTQQIWSEVDRQIGNYVRGKALEILIVGSAAYMLFAFMGLQYAAMLATLVGFSVLIPYLGAAAVTIPVALVAFFQWGFTANFSYLLVFYLVLQALDGNVLVPLLFSEVVNLHPVAIILAILIFGGLGGFWGVFFAIPLATLVQAILNAWPKALLSQP